MFKFIFPGEHAKSRTVWSTWQGLHDCGTGSVEWIGRGTGWPHRPPGVQLQPDAAALPMHAGSDAWGISCMWLSLIYSLGQGRIGYFFYIKVLWSFNVFHHSFKLITNLENYVYLLRCPNVVFILSFACVVTWFIQYTLTNYYCIYIKYWNFEVDNTTYKHHFDIIKLNFLYR